MEIAFASKELRSICEITSRAEQVLGYENAKKLNSRLADIEAAQNIEELLLGRPRVKRESINSYLYIDLTNDYVMILSPNHPKLDSSQCSREQWRTISRLKLVELRQHNVFK